eukprot:GFUD01002717.1.p1 GENE.GFUD01002717.1~~GFUD01002717.1.p1  ORF type:complete len:169 (+),score=34.02 GFUD01002717.1:153-659(+)
MSAAATERDQLQQANSAGPPSYDAAMSGQSYPPPPAGYPATPAGYPGSGFPFGQASSLPGQVYHSMPEKAGGNPRPMQTQPPLQVVYVTSPMSFGTNAVTMMCPHCQRNITTKTDSEPSALAWIIGGMLCFVGLCCCACVPCCIDSLNQVTHSCPSCNNTLGRYKGGL